MDERSPPAPLVPVGTDVLKYVSGNADEEFPPTCGRRPCMCRHGPGAAQTEGWVCVQPGPSCPWPAPGRGAAGPLLSGLLYIVWLLYGNDYDVAVPPVFL